eukprot:TRINITY_DN2736_c0_g1_i1.p1 TRINITY_DN2736_c0_g1~~TRINITY_DN2736_c0_g1_i1.p1  ORF type:complete len:297 (+),score=51.19 TRINITY_DN2736_c0_g1_i1:48-893(+)
MLRQILFTSLLLICEGKLIDEWCVEDYDCNPNLIEPAEVSCDKVNKKCICGVYTTPLNAGNGPCVGDDVRLDTEETTLVPITAEYRFDSAPCVREEVMEREGRAIFKDMFGMEPLFMNFTSTCGNRNNLRNDVILSAFFLNVSFAKAKTVDPTVDFTNNQYKYPELELLGPASYVDVRGGSNICKSEFPTYIALEMAEECIPVLCEYSYAIKDNVCTFVPYDVTGDSLSGGAIAGIVLTILFCCGMVGFAVFCFLNKSEVHPEDEVCFLFLLYFSFDNSRI